MSKATRLFLLLGVAMACGGCIVAPYEYGAVYYDHRPYPYASGPYYFSGTPYVEVVPAWPVYRPYAYPYHWHRGPVHHHRPWRHW